MLNFSLLDKAIIHFDSLLRTRTTSNNYPAQDITNAQQLSATEQADSVRMMRINHSGEICAQALYHGQALLARNSVQYKTLMQAAAEENDHLTWCKIRLQELRARPSLFNPVWYAGSFAIGVLAGAAGDRISLGFLAETEYQVTAHLDQHLRAMSYNDSKSRCILQRMRHDELQHATQAVAAGATTLPTMIKFAMQFTAKIMTATASKL